MLEKGLDILAEAEDARRAAEGKSRVQLNFTDVGACPAKLWNRLKEIPETQPLTFDSRMAFLVGHAVEEAVATALEAAHQDIFTMHREVRMQLPAGGTLIHGRSDFILEEDGILIELKSTGARNLAMIQKYNDGGRPEHVSQANLYSHAAALGLLMVEDRPLTLRGARLVYIGTGAKKGDEICLEYPVEYEPERAKYDLGTLALVWTCFTKGVRPTCDCGKRFVNRYGVAQGPLYCSYGPQYPCCEGL